MLSLDELHAAGDRAAWQPVAPPPPVAELEQEVGRRRGRQRAIVAAGSAVVMAAGLVMAVILVRPGDGPVEVLAAEPLAAEPGDGAPPGSSDQAGSADAADGPANDQDAAADRPPARDGSDPGNDSIVIERSVTGSGFSGLFTLDGPFDFEARLVKGEPAAALGAEAAEAADETRTVDGVELWITNRGDQLKVSAMTEPDRFVEVTGPADSIDELIEMVTTQDFPIHPFPDGPPFGEHGSFPDLEELLPERLLPHLDRKGWWLEGDLFDDRPWFSDGLDSFDDVDELDRYLDERFGTYLDRPCIRIEVVPDDGEFRLEVPDDCAQTG